MTDEQRIDALIPYGSLLKPDKEGFRGSHSGKFNGLDDFFIKDSAFEAIHVNLSHALRLVALEDLVINRGTAKYLLRIWHCSGFVKNANGELFAINKAYSLAIEDGQLIISCDGLKYEDVKVPGLPIFMKLPLGVGATNITVDPGWLNECYPDWQSRFSITTDIGLEPIEVLQSVLSQQVIVTPKTPPEDLAL